MNLSADLSAFADVMESRGWFLFEAALDQTLVARLAADLEAAWATCQAVQARNGIDADANLTAHHVLGQGDSFLDYLEASAPLDPFFESYFQGRYILNSFGGSINLQGRENYFQRIHRDIRSYSDRTPLLLNTLVMLDDFTRDNGATYLLTGGHRHAVRPSDDEFYANATQAVGPAGSILVFNSNLWHAGGRNLTDRPRRSLTPMYCRPFIKPQFDYPRALGYDDGASFTPYVRQVVGYNARVPATLDEWYQPPQRRMYQGDQG
jgi:hypothetical protein